MTEVWESVIILLGNKNPKGGVNVKYLTKDIMDFYEKAKDIADVDLLAEELNAFAFQNPKVQYMWGLRDLFRKLEERHLDKYPLLCVPCGAIAICEGELEKAKEYIDKLDDDNEIKVFAEMEMPYTTDEELVCLAKKIEKKDRNTIPKISFTAGRPSIVNGNRDFTYFFTTEDKDKEKIFNLLSVFYGEEQGKNIQKIINAENLYQQNELYDALVEVSGVIPKLRKSGDFQLLFAALYIELETLLMSGEIKTTTMKMEEIRRQIQSDEYEEYMQNLTALDAWTAMYDGEYDRVRKWMEEDAPDDGEEFCMLDLFQYFIKMRAYIIEGRHLALYALGAKIIPILKAGHRHMDLCHIYMLIAMNEYAMGKKEIAFENLEKTLAMAEERRYDRLIADEGTRMYELLTDYAKARGKSEYLQRVTDMAYKVAIDYPKYMTTKKTTLSDKEYEVLKMLGKKLKAEEIAKKMGISVETVKTHKRKIYKKLGVKTQGEAVNEGRRAGLI